MSNTKQAAQTKRVNVALDQAMLDRLDELAPWVAPPGAKPRRAAALRAAISRGLELLEAEARKTAKRPRG